MPFGPTGLPLALEAMQEPTTVSVSAAGGAAAIASGVTASIVTAGRRCAAGRLTARGGSAAGRLTARGGSTAGRLTTGFGSTAAGSGGATAAALAVPTKQTGVSDVRAGDDHHGSKSCPLHLEISSTFRVEFVSVAWLASIVCLWDL